MAFQVYSIISMKNNYLQNKYMQKVGKSWKNDSYHKIDQIVDAVLNMISILDKSILSCYEILFLDP